MLLFNDTFIPYEFTKEECLRHVESRCQNLKKSLKLITMDSEHLEVRCPLSGDYLEIVGSEQEINWLHAELTKRKWYK
jgi:hypothetical protein